MSKRKKPGECRKYPKSNGSLKVTLIVAVILTVIFTGYFLLTVLDIEIPIVSSTLSLRQFIPTKEFSMASEDGTKHQSKPVAGYQSGIACRNPDNTSPPTMLVDLDRKLEQLQSQNNEFQARINKLEKIIKVLDGKHRINNDIQEFQTNIKNIQLFFILALLLIVIMFTIIIFIICRISFRITCQETTSECLEQRLDDFEKKRYIPQDVQPKPKKEPVNETRNERNDYYQRFNDEKNPPNRAIQSNMYQPLREPIESTKTLTMEEYTLKFIQHYNNATQADDKWSFESRYKPMRMGLNTSHDVFEPRSDGDYWAINISNYATNEFFIVPRFMPFDSNLYKAGGMGRVFDCNGYDPNYRYNHVVLVKPAVFLKAENTWRMKRNGLLQLEQGELIS